MYDNAAELPKSTNQAERKRNIETASKQSSELNNPCLKEQKISYKCLSDNNYDRDSCLSAFANYKACMQFWTQVKAERRNKGIRPYLPRPEEREAIRAEFLAKLHGKDGKT